jgi:hypothetical protein
MSFTVAQPPAEASSKAAPEVMPCAALLDGTLEQFVAAHGMSLQRVGAGETIPGSYWGESEAGLQGDTLFVRADTPVHSALHELCHWLCMDPQRRAALHTDAGGEDIEESGVCYLQGLLADTLPGYSSYQLFADMDAWGYHFRLGGAQAWFERDAEDARAWLIARGLIDGAGRPVGPRRA